jgi:hypothetical protein
MIWLESWRARGLVRLLIWGINPAIAKFETRSTGKSVIPEKDRSLLSICR